SPPGVPAHPAVAWSPAAGSKSGRAEVGQAFQPNAAVRLGSLTYRGLSASPKRSPRGGRSTVKPIIPLTLALLTLAPPAPATGPKAGGTVKLYVTNSAGDDIHVIDLNTRKVVGRIKTAAHPHGAAASADGRRFFSTVESDHTLLVFDTATDKVL